MAESKKELSPETVEAIAARGWEACLEQWELSDEPVDTGAWNNHAKVVRDVLRRLSEMPAQSMSELAAKARMLAIVIEAEGKNDYRFALAESLLDDIRTLNALPAPTARR